MARGVRIRVRSAITGAGTPNVTVPGGTLALEPFGSGTTQSQRDVGSPAEIVFHAAFLDEVRRVSEPEYEPFASLSGALLRDGVTGDPVFVCSADTEIVYAEPDPSEDDPIRRLTLGFDPASFREPPEPDSSATRLRLPTEPEGARFFELGLELKVSGAVEASAPFASSPPAPRLSPGPARPCPPHIARRPPQLW